MSLMHIWIIIFLHESHCNSYLTMYFSEDKLIYLDPHYCQDVVDTRERHFPIQASILIHLYLHVETPRKLVFQYVFIVFMMLYMYTHTCTCVYEVCNFSVVKRNNKDLV